MKLIYKMHENGTLTTPQSVPDDAIVIKDNQQKIVRVSDAQASLVARKLELLDFIHQNPMCSWVDAINRFLPQREIRETEGFLTGFIECGDLKTKGSKSDPSTYRLSLSESGVMLRVALQEMHDKQAQDEGDRRFDRKMRILTVMIPLITFILGLIVEHFGNLVGALLALFHS